MEVAGLTPGSFNFSITATASDIRAALRSVLPSNSTTSNTGVSVIDGSKLTRTFTFSVNNNILNGFTISGATLVLLDAPATEEEDESNCTWRNLPPGTPITPNPPVYGGYGGYPPPPSYSLTEVVISNQMSVSDPVENNKAAVAGFASMQWVITDPATSNNSAPLPWNATRDTVRDAVKAVTGVSTYAAIVTGPVRDGADWSYTWDVQFAWDLGSNIPLLAASMISDSAPGTTLVARLLQVASAPLEGTLKLSMDPWCDVVEVDPAADTGAVIAAKLARLPAMSGKQPRTVTKSGDAANGWKLRVVFDPVATPGDLGQLRIASHGLTGNNIKL